MKKNKILHVLLVCITALILLVAQLPLSTMALTADAPDTYCSADGLTHSVAFHTVARLAAPEGGTPGDYGDARRLWPRSAQRDGI